jgi:hypothetical protein
MIQTCSHVFIYSFFKLKQNEITQVTCIQKNAPRNCCQGKCQLKARFNSDDGNHKDQNTLVLKHKQDVCCDQLFVILGIRCLEVLRIQKKIDLPEIRYISCVMSDIFHPPKDLGC